MNSKKTDGPKRRSVLLKLFFRLLLMVVAIIVGVLLVEIFLAVFAPFGIDHFANRRVYEEVFVGPAGAPGVNYELKRERSVEAGVLYRTNNLGARGGEVAIPKPDGIYRIVFSGDSNTFGWGVAEEDTFVARVERGLNERARPPGTKRFECVNLSALAYNTVQEAALLRSKGMMAEPDVMCIVFCMNDVLIKGKDDDYVRIERDMFESRRSTLDRFFADNLGPFLKRAGLYHIHDFLTYLFISRYNQTYYETVERFFHGIDEGFVLVKDSLKEFNRFAKKRGLPFVLLDLTGKKELEALANEHGFGYVNLFDAEIQRSPEYWNSYCDPHPNADGHAFYAGRILDGIHPWIEGEEFPGR